MLAAPPRPKRRVEFIGDSITCGHGNESKGVEDPFISATENNYLAYGAIAARMLKAEYVCIAWSGKGMYQNRRKNQRNTMPDLYGRTLPHNKKSVWDFQKWMPDAVVINLGTNDFAHEPPTEEEFTGAYSKMILRIRGNHPKAHVFCCVGPIITNTWPKHKQHLTRTRTYLLNMIKRLEKQGIKNVHYVEIPGYKDDEEVGAGYHPSVKIHLRMATQLAQEIGAKLGWD